MIRKDYNLPDKSVWKKCSFLDPPIQHSLTALSLEDYSGESGKNEWKFIE